MAAMDDKSIMPFGKYKGEMLINVPANYLIWWEGRCKRDDWRDLQQYIKENIDVLKKEAAQDARRYDASGKHSQGFVLRYAQNG